MPDTRRSVSALQTLYADNTSGAIGADDGRDLLVSCHPENVVQSGAYASFPASPLTGDLFLPTNGAHLHRYNGSAWKAFGPLFPLTPVPSSGWTWVNQGSGVATHAGGTLNLYCPDNGGGGANSLRGYYRTAPTAPYTVTFLFSFAPSYLDDSAAGNGIADVGVFFREAGGKLISYSVEVNTAPGGKLTGYAWDSATAINTTYLNRSINLSPGTLFWMRLFDDNTNKGLKVSPDGVDWTIVPHSHARATFMTPTQYGFFVNPYSMKTSATLFSVQEG